MVQLKVTDDAKATSQRPQPQAGVQGQGPLLKHNVNIFLLLFILFIVILAVVYAVTYQNRLHGLSGSYENTTNNLTMCMQELSATKQSLINAVAKINESERDVKTYDVIYEKKESELSTTKDMLSTSEKDLTLTKTKLERTEDLYADTKLQVQDLQTKYTAAQAQLTAKSIEITNLKARINCYMTHEGDSEDSC